MSNYTKSTNFATKDNLSPGDPLKVVRGTEIDTEFNNISTAIATKTDNSAAAITGGSITGITDLAVADGGTGASTAAGALNNLLPSQTSNANKYLQTDGTNATWDAVSLSTADITGTLGVANGGTGVTSSTGTGSVVLSNSPTLVTPVLGTPSSGTATNLTGLPISTGVSGLGTGVATALAVNVGSSGAPVVNGGVLGTPSSGTLTNATGLPIATGVSGLGTGVATFLATPSSANLAAALTDETGSGANVFATSPTLVTPVLGTPTSATLTNATGLPLTTGVTGTLPTANGGTNLTSFTSGGVVYASSSSALATGSGLIFDGTNLGVGVTPSAFGSGRKALQLGGAGYVIGVSQIDVGVNYYYDTAYRYVGTGFASSYQSYNGLHAWFTAASGTAGNAITFTQAMTLDASGNLGIGTSSPASKLHLITNNADDSGGIRLERTSGTDGRYNEYISSSGDLTFTETGVATRITLQKTTGNVGIGTSSPALGGARAYSKVLTIDGGTNTGIESTGALELGSSTNVNDRLVGSITFFNRDNSGSGGFTRQQVGLIEAKCVTSDSNADDDSGGTLVFLTKAEAGFVTEKMRLTSDGNLLVGSTTAVSGGGVLQVSNGITFPATQSASSNANTLDDYEEGTWTPTVAGSTTAGTVAYSYRNGHYTKIGRLLYVWFDLEVSSFSGGVGGLTVGSFPFPAANLTNFYPTFQPWTVASAYADTYTTPTGIIDPNGSVLNLYSTDDGHASFATMKVNQIGRIAGYLVMQTS